MSAVHDIRLFRLLALARTMQPTTARDAAGRCLSLSLDFALAAQQRHHITLRLVKWRVVGDANHLDHWATVLDNGTVIDLTRVQVDGRTALVGTLDGYPHNFVAPALYPLALLRDAYAPEQASNAARLSSAFLGRCGVRLLRFDFGAAWRNRSAVQAAGVLREAAKFGGYFAMDCLTRALRARACLLMMRLRTRPGLSARISRDVGTTARGARRVRKTG